MSARAPLYVAGSVGVTGVAGAQASPSCERVRLAVPGLPRGLQGLTILQVSDVHLGGGLGLDWLTDALETARAEKPDLLVMTGDLSDDLELMGPALRALVAFPAPLGRLDRKSVV